MKIAYASCLISDRAYKELFSRQINKPGQQVQKYHRLLAEGFVKNGISVETVSAPPITRTNYTKRFYRRKQETENGLVYNYLSVVNVGVLKNILMFLGSFVKTICIVAKNKGSIVICDVLNVSVSAGALLAAKIAGRKSVGIVTDIPEMQQVSKKKFSLWINNKILYGFSSYVFLTEQMNEKVNLKKRPYVVVEGHVDIGMRDVENKPEDKYEQKVCLYAGALHIIYGIKMLVEAFLNADMPDSEIHIYGAGDYEDELKEISQRYKQVKYFGSVANQTVVEEQLKATLLVNPRPSNEEFTKYSFPSKNMEYMASGTPALTARLPGMPKDYEDYVYIFTEETVDGLASSLKSILNKSKDELHQKGMAAKEFVLKNKNNVSQAKKIIDGLFNY